MSAIQRARVQARTRVHVHARRLAAAGVLTAISVAGLATAASAHVTVNPGTAEQGGYTKVSFRVPNERDDAGTTKVRVDLPADHPLASVSVRPVPGWTVKVDKSRLPTPVQTEGGELTEAVTRITWTGGRIEAGQFQEFDVSMGPIPTGIDRLVFKTEQTYSGGEVVKWDQNQVDGQDEPEHPAPVLRLTPKGATAVAEAGPADKAKAGAPSGGGEDDGTARLLGGLGLAAGVIGIAAGGLGLARSRRSRS
ncbi:YcnI family copper-binding membrane protein [Spirillospora sp. NBC_01491]|uniref:YcnI family copper-binding membrane protein n=1 Tax=Spirillospora sp. NBC_01491 TaxID=2976007 RepID=UPI002E333372|nr:YcnI family protein [Spirillospora sp. NBC_01491]